ncbi:hypothetical protein mRhiFer1_009496 [Rhinolophus ferrumequinum]|uniref:DUF1725 domain-containing protein n=1 Tax=Rhinolophus ferrumequinum TaxID=59479 RepID=A0A7J7RET4_RHIFE|nr:hypothetical protein mRhiFer1_009496 [Rhinolophus ferrumequinum]
MHRAPREGRRWPGKGFQSASLGAGARPGRTLALMEKPTSQGLLKVKRLLTAPEKIRATKATELLGCPGFRSLRQGWPQGHPPQPAVPCRAHVRPQPRGPSASPRAISRASLSQPRWPPSSTAVKIWKQPTSASKDVWIKKMWLVYTMEYYSATKKNGILPFATTWMDLADIMLSAVSQTEKDKYHMISLICGI